MVVVPKFSVGGGATMKRFAHGRWRMLDPSIHNNIQPSNGHFAMTSSPSMFPALALVQIYEEALRLLSDPNVMEQKVWLHDYDTPAYRNDPSYTLNGLHWGYPSGIASSITGKHIPNDSSSYAFFDHLIDASRRSDCKRNSRFQLVRYGDVKEIVEKGIQQKLDKARAEVPAIQKILERWKTKVDRDFAAYRPAALRIDVGPARNRNTLHIVVLSPERFESHGMGSFLQVGPGDVSVSPAARALLAETPYRLGMNFLEVLPPNIIGFLGCDLEMNRVRPASVSVDPQAWRQLEGMLIEQR